VFATLTWIKPKSAPSHQVAMSSNANPAASPRAELSPMARLMKNPATQAGCEVLSPDRAEQSRQIETSQPVSWAAIMVASRPNNAHRAQSITRYWITSCSAMGIERAAHGPHRGVE
jgi:hypothetical protein